MVMRGDRERKRCSLCGGDSTSSGAGSSFSPLGARLFIANHFRGPSYDEYDNERAAVSIIFLINARPPRALNNQ